MTQAASWMQTWVASEDATDGDEAVDDAPPYLGRHDLPSLLLL
jgi:hypothetical protein